MKKLPAAILCDLRLQFRNGFYYATLFVLAFFIVVLTWLPGINPGRLLPLIILLNMNFTGFYFIGGIVLLEKDEGTLKARAVTPLKSGNYLLARIISISVLIILESIVLVVILSGFNFRFISLITGVLLAAVLFVLTGFLAVAFYDSIDDYLLPSVGYSAIVSLPVIMGFAGLENWLLYLHPLQTALVFLNNAFIAVSPWQIVYGVIYSCLWITVIYQICKRVFWKMVLDG